jgi:hypothetical protein
MFSLLKWSKKALKAVIPDNGSRKVFSSKKKKFLFRITFCL